MRSLVAAAAAIASLVSAQAVDAQTTAWHDKARVSINVGVQPSPITFSATTTSPLYAETSTFTTSYTVPKGKLFDGGILFRVAGSLGVGVALSSFSEHQDGAVSGSLPHPFFFNAPRSISGTAPNLQRSETGTHVLIAYVIASKRIDVAVEGGPSFFNISQDLVTTVGFTETYPYDTATFSSASVTKATASKIGFNAGADVGFKLSRNIGVGGLIRFSRASVQLPLAGSASGVTVDAGGTQVGGGIRFYF